MVQARRGLIATQGRPWAEYGKSGKPISKNQLAKRLKRFKIVPDSVRLWDKTLKGYYRHQFQEAWDRYLSSALQDPPPKRSAVTTPIKWVLLSRFKT